MNPDADPIIISKPLELKREVVWLTMAASKKCGDRDRVMVSLSRNKFDPSAYIYNPRFDLGIEEEWLPKHPVIKSRIATQPSSATL